MMRTLHVGLRVEDLDRSPPTTVVPTSPPSPTTVIPEDRKGEEDQKGETEKCGHDKDNEKVKAKEKDEEQGRGREP